MRFALFDAVTVGNQVGSPLTNSPVSVSNGLFTVTLDFGANFPGADRWLEIGVRTNGNGTFFTLSPRQKITPSPYAIYAAGASAAGISGTIPTANLTGTYGSPVTFSNAANSFSGNGTGLTNVNATTLGGLGAANFWVVGGIASGVVSNMAFSTSGTNAITAAAQANNVAMGVITNGVFRVFNVMDYGAVPDGITDCTAAIQAAVNAAVGGTNSPTTVFFPYAPNDTHNIGVGAVQPGKYYLAGTVTITNLGVRLLGEISSMGNTSAFLHTNGTPAFYVRNSYDATMPVSFENFTFSGDFFNPDNVGIFLEGVGYAPKIEYCIFYYYGTGIVLSNQFYANITRSEFECGLPIKLVNSTQTKIELCDFQESKRGIASDGGNLDISSCIFGGVTHWNGPMTNAIWITDGGSLPNVSVSNTKFNVPGATGGVVIGQFVTETGGNYSFDNCEFRNDYGGSNLCYVVYGWSPASYASFRNCFHSVLPWFGIQNSDNNIINVDNPYQGGPGGTNTVMLDGSRLYTSTQIAPAFRMTQPMNIDGNVTASGTFTGNGSGLTPIAAYAGPVCTNGLSYFWNSNGTTFHRSSAIGSTTWTEALVP